MLILVGVFSKNALVQELRGDGLFWYMQLVIQLDNLAGIL